MPRTRPSIGDKELALLRHLAAHENASVGEVAAAFGESSGLARSTVLTMMERLRAKGYLRRRRSDGVYRYSTATAPGDAVRNAVGQFVEKTLSGSVSPFVAWLAERGEVSDEELDELKALVAQLQTRQES
ncbi:BlaI/MecI/CopY family transcriptional regulator [Oleiagrimonas soli]|uniref:Methicillin resistance protein n=1 Tax=Oleiagrimonas soli TaxID=1543381 RepID=A0A099CZP1_9GAMM|nr:BlaI/MecI/CopY family transcriptional regulator [Oleiagrimonas soli]KGI79027.1 methicillin resistance protein [Oleiagrimonas soli]MBB6184613.1 putative transcriptional regulator [Oleiagrimonas soli]